jgi:periplasmic divalent cation tolerance protein
MIFIYVTCASKKEAEKISGALLKKKLVACTNYYPINSMYWWKGRIEKAREFALILKTADKNFEKIRKEIKKIHSYAVPCIIEIRLNRINKDYLDWLNSCL